MSKERNLQKEAVELFGMEVQLMHAVEELTELSLEAQRNIIAIREGFLGADILQLLSEYCDGRNALKTIELFLQTFEVDTVRIEEMQRAKDRKFAHHIDEAKRKQQ